MYAAVLDESGDAREGRTKQVHMVCRAVGTRRARAGSVTEEYIVLAAHLLAAKTTQICQTYVNKKYEEKINIFPTFPEFHKLCIPNINTKLKIVPKSAKDSLFYTYLTFMESEIKNNNVSDV